MSDRAKILFVDDEANILKAVQRVLHDGNYEILTARSGEEGLKLIRDNQDICVVVSDYRMPGMSGVAFLDEVSKKWPGISRIMISAYGDIVSRVVGMEEDQVLALLTKPCDGDELKKAISDAVLIYEQKSAGRPASVAELSIEEDKEDNEDDEDGDNLFLAEAILEKLPAAVISFDDAKRVVQCNREARKILGMGKKDVIDKSLNSIISAADRIELYGAMRKEGKWTRTILNGKKVKIKTFASGCKTGPKISSVVIEEDSGGVGE